MNYILCYCCDRLNPPYLSLKIKATSTFPLRDFGHRQVYGSPKHFMALRVLGINTSPSSRKSLEPFKM